MFPCSPKRGYLETVPFFLLCMLDVGRPTVFTPEVLQKLEQAFSMGCTDNEASIYANIAISSLYNYQKQNPEFLDRKEQLKENPILKARTKVFNEIEKNVLTAQWYLERKKKDEFAVRTEMTGDKGKDLTVNVISYGDNDTLQLAARKTSTPNITEPSEIQGNNMAPQSPQDNTSDKRTDTLGNDSEGDILVHSPVLQPSEENNMARPGDVGEVLSAGDMEKQE